MSHVLNPILGRLVNSRWVDNPQGIGRYLDTYKRFVSCGCGWYEWINGSDDDAQDAWIGHMTTQLVP